MILKKTFSINCLFLACLFLAAFSTVHAQEKSVILRKNETGNIYVERIGNSVYVRFHNVYTFE